MVFRDKAERAARKYLQNNLKVPLQRYAKLIASTAEEISTARIVTEYEQAAYTKALNAKKLAQQAVQKLTQQRNETRDMVQLQQQFQSLLPPILFPTGSNESTIQNRCNALPKKVQTILSQKA